MSPIPRCGCADACSCLITAGNGIQVEGIGTLENPYQITSDSAELAGRVNFTDDGTVDFTTTGVGTALDPLTVFADAMLAMKDLTDTPDTTPANGQVPVWRTDHWAWEAQTGGGASLPSGGTVGQVLTKLSGTDGDANWRADPFIQELAGGVDLNTLVTPGVYSQSQTTEAASGTNYPVPQAGLLEVFAVAGSPAMVWQRYTVYFAAPSGALPFGTVFVRGLYQSTWQPWKQSGGLYADHADCSASTTLSTTVATDITGMTLSVPVVRPESVYLVTTVYDFQTMVATAATVIGQLLTGGTTQSPQAIYNAGNTAGRAVVSQTYRITGLAAGTVVFKGQAQCATANNYKVNNPHSGITVQQVA